ncbi:carnitine O-acetyltransferase [Trypanosoma rangeli SC58]|uniref:Carnitine O-acetyltransferase n=1 Tax=Trypanosoma rangeli SC58 TaxID=429131 RepID=A0A061IYV1_TRYRA|nr:carnitine O-acetyltransferase [Trypanosoma rangeli SC58]
MEDHFLSGRRRQTFASGFAASGARRPAYLDAPLEYHVSTRSPVAITPLRRTRMKECFSAYGYTDPVDMKERIPSSDDLQLAQHQTRLPRLPIPTIEETCSRFLKSIEAIASAEEYFVAMKLIDEFKAAGGVGEQLDALLREWDKRCGQPSWLEEFWDDAYLCPRNPIPINVNYFFGFSAHPNKQAMTRTGRAASLLYGAVSYHMDIRHDKLLCEFERDKPVCMNQNRFLCCTSRVPGKRRDRMVCYCEVPALSKDALESKSVEYVSSPEPPRHCIVIQRNRFFSLNVLKDEDTVVDVEELLVALELIEETVRSVEEPGPPVGLLTTMNRSDWFEAREHLERLGNHDTLRAIQSAIICIALDSVQVMTSDEAARIFLHGGGTNRWFDRHNIIVTRDSWAGVNWEHSVTDATATLRLADRMYQSDCEHAFTKDLIAELVMDASRRLRAAALFTELEWVLDSTVNDTMKRAFRDYKKMIEANETAVLRFCHFGGARIKDAKIPPDSFVQLAFQLTYYRLLGRACATYETASTRTFLHGRTECVRSATRASLDFCRMSSDPIFTESVGSFLPTQRVLMREAMKQHTKNMQLAKNAYGIRPPTFLACVLQAVKPRLLPPFVIIRFTKNPFVF